MCLELGFASPDHLLAALTSKQITEWQAYYFVTSGEYEKTKVNHIEVFKAGFINAGMVIKKEK